MVFLIGLGIILVAAMIVSVPLYRGMPEEVAAGGEDEAAAWWEKQKRDAYSAIKEADMDLRMGKLSQEDYQAIRSTEEARALEALRALGGNAPGGSKNGG